ncbi:MAG: hypothetical protein R3250_09435, partial [Melioribacteraceae bacterium]|nr:hypothetical protein [Melioribacteraceae bacterium]
IENIEKLYRSLLILGFIPSKIEGVLGKGNYSILISIYMLYFDRVKSSLIIYENNTSNRHN